MTKCSICMVSLNCLNVLKPCLESLASSEPELDHEVIIVDNASTDGTVAYLRSHHPAIRVIQNHSNVGFTKATNQAIRESQGDHILWLNTDTLIRPGSLTTLCTFLDSHPQVGIVGPKVLNLDGSFQPQCKRGMPTPSASFFYMTGLHKLLPTNPRAGQYLLAHLSPDEAHQVDAVSGCCLMARREVVEQIGLLDEDIFAFGEDIDWCVRAKKSGWEVWYYPGSVIVHLKGQGGVHSAPLNKVRGMHDGMWVFYSKHLQSQYPVVVNSAVWLAIKASLYTTTFGIWVRQKLA